MGNVAICHKWELIKIDRHYYTNVTAAINWMPSANLRSFVAIQLFVMVLIIPSLYHHFSAIWDSSNVISPLFIILCLKPMLFDYYLPLMTFRGNITCAIPRMR
ncbi:hypothetical protein BO71DRAFT_140980 [Aspergillus ellipticus CBS 707.79]|uniref:Uncharacterized protein n=1 Tax=Aspergillus ellipticus CBS 707.79 TaxID=1448320 RepID=A0A319DBH4_9EURO|nr:hypothetical protein BO71DRAFT_140980 [Aspergillus ellipticus CBS 707.79]